MSLKNSIQDLAGIVQNDVELTDLDISVFKVYAKDTINKLDLLNQKVIDSIK